MYKTKALFYTVALSCHRHVASRVPPATLLPCYPAPSTIHGPCRPPSRPTPSCMHMHMHVSCAGAMRSCTKSTPALRSPQLNDAPWPSVEASRSRRRSSRAAATGARELSTSCFHESVQNSKAEGKRSRVASPEGKRPRALPSRAELPSGVMVVGDCGG